MASQKVDLTKVSRADCQAYESRTMNEKALKKLLTNIPEICDILKIIEQLKLPDAWLCAGSIRNIIWNYLSNQSPFDSTTDIDVSFLSLKSPMMER